MSLAEFPPILKMLQHPKILLSLCILILVHQAVSQVCYEPGLCIDGVITGINTDVSSYDQCLQACKNNANCQWFSYLGNDKDCVMFLDCPDIDSSFENTYSGEESCASQLICNMAGFCDGALVNYQNFPTTNECINFCKSDDDCQWYTHYQESGECFLTSSCQAVDDACNDCVHGQKECNTNQYYSNLLFAIGSFNSYYSAEIVDLSGQGRTCPDISDFPTRYGSVGTFIGDKAMACGGYPNANVEDKCYEYNATNDSWMLTTLMNEERRLAAGIHLDADQWWVTGDYSHGNDITTEIYHLHNNSFTVGNDLPVGRSFHHLVRFNETHVIMLGDMDPTTSTYFYNLITNEWTDGPDSQVSRDQPLAGFIRFKNGTEVIALVGGYALSSGEYLGVADLVWRMGPSLPRQNVNGCVAQLENTFVIAGNGYSLYGRDILMFDLDIEEWVILPQKLKEDRQESACFFVPDDYVDCI